MSHPLLATLFVVLLLAAACSHATADEVQKAVTKQPAAVSFQLGDDSLQIALGDQAIAEYVFRDQEILRPYFRHLRTPSGKLLTRNHPPVKGQDPEDHAAMHPGLWLAFGDISGADFWRNRGRVRHLRFVEEGEWTEGSGSFVVENAYEVEGRTICTELCTITLTPRLDGYLLHWSSTFQSEADFTFGDQEEMGLGVRVATPLAVDKGGEIRNSENRKNGSQVWGQQSDWCQYGGVIDGQRIGIVLMPSPKNFRRSWFHARDYGLLVANPFGQNAFTKGEKSQITVKPGDKLNLSFGVLIYEVSEAQPLDVAEVYRQFIEN